MDRPPILDWRACQQGSPRQVQPPAPFRTPSNAATTSIDQSPTTFSISAAIRCSSAWVTSLHLPFVVVTTR